MTKAEMAQKLREAYKYFEELSYKIDLILTNNELNELDPNLNKILHVANELEFD